MQKPNAFSGRLCVVLALAVAGMLSSVVSGESTGQCQVHWKRVAGYANRVSVPTRVSLEYTMGLAETEERTGTTTDTRTMAAELKTEIEGISASYTSSMTHTVVTSRMSSRQLTTSHKRTIHITVPPKTVHTVWQLAVQYRRYSIELSDTEILEGSAPPSTVGASCTLERRSQGMAISNTTPVRLRHKRTGQYLITIGRKGWEAATLGNSRNVHFRLLRASDGEHVRIELIRPMFRWNKFAYSSYAGGIYFDRYSSGAVQQWKLSNISPIDGDAVTLRNKYWPSAGLVHHDGPATNVYCLSRGYRRYERLDEWIIEAV